VALIIEGTTKCYGVLNVAMLASSFLLRTQRGLYEKNRTMVNFLIIIPINNIDFGNALLYN